MPRRPRIILPNQWGQTRLKNSKLAAELIESNPIFTIDSIGN